MDFTFEVCTDSMQPSAVAVGNHSPRFDPELCSGLTVLSMMLLGSCTESPLTPPSFTDRYKVPKARTRRRSFRIRASWRVTKSSLLTRDVAGT